MRPLTPAEVLVVGALLDSSAATERSRIRRTGLPSRTYEAAAQRLRASGLVYDRYVPNPTRFGVPSVIFGLVHPFVENLGVVARRWVRTSGSVVVWKGLDWVFGVFFRRGSVGAPPLPQTLVARDECGRTSFLATDARDPQVPAYFDFEGAWSSLAGVPSSPSYPRPLPGAGEAIAMPMNSASRTAPRVVGLALARRPLSPPASATGSRWRSPRFFSREERRALESGLVVRRVFLDIGGFPPTTAGRVSDLVWIGGRIRDHHAPEGLFAGLLGRSKVAPFLFATDERRVLLGALSHADAPGRKSTRANSRRASVSGVLRQYLQEIEVVRAPLESVSVLLDHRYDRLLTEADASSDGTNVW